MQMMRSSIATLLPRTGLLAPPPPLSLVSLRGWASAARELDLSDEKDQSKSKDQKYVDRIKITARAGDGGKAR